MVVNNRIYLDIVGLSTYYYQGILRLYVSVVIIIRKSIITVMEKRTQLPQIARKLSKRIKQLREDKKWTQEEVAERIGMDMRYYQRLESKKPYVIRIDTLEKIAKAFKITASKLLDFK